MLVSRKKYNSLKEELAKMQDECIKLQDEKYHIKHKLETYQQAEEKGCKKGEYCQICAFGHENFDYIHNTFSTDRIKYYICEFGLCKHFVCKDQ